MNSEPVPAREIAWPHAPTHRLGEAGTYFVTASTYKKSHHFRGAKRLGVLQRGLLSLAMKYGWQLEAWAVFSNHYHFVGHSPDEDAKSLSPMLNELNTTTARWINRLDGEVGRRVWHNFRETQLTSAGSYFARLNYTHHNAVKHGLVHQASNYPYCSAGWFEQTATPAQVRTVYGFKFDQLKIPDDFEPVADW